MSAKRQQRCAFEFVLHVLSGYSTVLRIQNVYLGSNFFPSHIPDPNFFYLGSQIAIIKFKYFYPKNCFLAIYI
jgi:hypothetical protein